MVVSDVDLMSSCLVSDILSLGKLLRAGFDFHLCGRGQQCCVVSPGDGYRVRIHLGDDVILRLQHAIRDEVSTPHQVFALRRSADNATSSFLHDVSNHMGMERIYQTLGVTRGYKQTRLQKYTCRTCAQAKARNFGLRQRRVRTVLSRSATPTR